MISSDLSYTISPGSSVMISSGRSIGPITYQQNLKDRIEKKKVTESVVGCPDQDISKLMEEKILLARKNKDTLGGSITCVASLQRI